MSLGVGLFRNSNLSFLEDLKLLVVFEVQCLMVYIR
jgi:hypothetical protein